MFRVLLKTRCVLLFLILLLPVLPATSQEGGRRIVIGGDLSDEALIQLSSWLAAGTGSETVFLLDSAFAANPNKAIVAGFQPRELLAVGFPAERGAELKERLDHQPDRLLEWKPAAVTELRRKLFPRMERVVVCPASPRRLLLHGAWLAGVARAPLFIAQGKDSDADELRRWLGDGPVREVVAVGEAKALCQALLASSQGPAPAAPKTDVPTAPRSTIRLETLTDEAAVNRAGREKIKKHGPIRNLVLCNPADSEQGLGRMSLLGPWMAAQKRGELLLTNAKGDNANAVVTKALARKDTAHAETLLLLASLKAIPTEKRPNPIAGKDPMIEMEPMTPKGNEPFTLGTGRLFHEDPAMVMVQQARVQLLPAHGRPRRALVVSNPGTGLPLLETFSRHTTNEFRNAGYLTTSLFGAECDGEKVRKLVPEQDIFLWEGHYRTLIDDYAFLTWKEQLPPSLYFLQSCLALKEEEASPLLQRGAMAVVGSSTRTYSGTGGAFTVAFFDAMLYDGQSLGGSLRQAKNFLNCYSLLKEKRLGEKAKLSGANVRSAWAFTLWGDPTLHLPKPGHPAPEKALQAVKHEVKGNTIHLTLPEQRYEKVNVGKYEATMLPNARLAGLLTMGGEKENNKTLVPFVFAEVHLAKAVPGKKPKLSSRIPERSYVFTWDERRKAGYLLVTPRKKDQTDLRFKVEWVD